MIDDPRPHVRLPVVPENERVPDVARPISQAYEVRYPAEGYGDGIDMATLLGTLRRHALLIAALTLVGLGLGYYLAGRAQPLFRATATVRVVEKRVLLADVMNAEASRVDPLMSQLVVLRGRGFVGELVDSAALRLIADTPGIRAFLEPVTVTLAPERASTLELTFAETDVRIEAGGRTVTASYGAPVSVPGLLLVPRERPPTGRPIRLHIMPREDAIDVVLRAFSAVPRAGTDAIDLAFIAPDPGLAERAANAAANVFRTVNARSVTLQAVRRRTFVQEQLGLAEARLIRAQRDVSEFRQREQVYSAGAMLESEQQNLGLLDTERERLSWDRQLYEKLLTLLTSPDRSERSVELRALLSSAQFASNAVIAQLVSRLQAQATQRDSLTLGRFALTPLHPEVQSLDTLTAVAETQLIAAVRGQMRSVDMRLEGIDERRKVRMMELSSLPEAEAEQVRLTREVEAAATTADQLRAEYEAARIAEAVEAGQVEIVSPASGAERLGAGIAPVLFAGPLLGLVLGCGIALALDLFNKSFRRSDEIETVLQLPGLAVIPNLAILRKPRLTRAAKANGANGSGRSARTKGDDAAKEPRRELVPLDSPAAEAFRALRTNVLFSSGIQHRKVLLVTSAGPGEGKTTTAANLAIALAQQGMRVLLVDADLRRPRVHALMSTPLQPGLSDLLAYNPGTVPEHCIYRTAVGLSVVPAGEPTTMPAELLGGSRMESWLHCFSQEFDKVVVDAAPVLAASEAAALASRADGVLVVVRAGSTDRDMAREALRRLYIVGADVLGVVINDPKEIMSRYGVNTYRYATHDAAV